MFGTRSIDSRSTQRGNFGDAQSRRFRGLRLLGPRSKSWNKEKKKKRNQQ
jgi:hypothetical protein